MGQKVNPVGLRLGINRTADSRWYADSAEYGRLLHEDLKVRNFIKGKLKQAGISKIVIERPHKKCLVTIHTARPGLVIGKKGADIESLRGDLSKIVSDEVRVNLVEVRKPEIDANLVAEDIARQLERRASFRRAMKRSIQSAMRLGALGCRVMVAGRLGGAEIARTEQYAEGSVPLHTLRADIDYGTAEALTTYGIIGIKVWIYKGEIMEHDPMAQDKKLESSGQARARSGGGRGPASGPQGGGN
ncbi:MAG: 30S ribosomal protein S3 [Hyphomonadaceae bacterium]|nr:30S ribosomal protein S3 [Hyphomonadaceae bacterium]